MKTWKKIAATLLIACMMVTCVPMVSHAADGSIRFSDPKTEAGKDFKVKITAKSASGSAIGDLKVEMSFDSSKIEFKKGEDVTADGDKLTYETTGDGEESSITTEMTFTALKKGTTKIEITDYEASLNDGGSWTCDEGNSTITVEGGTEIEPSNDSSEDSDDETEATSTASGDITVGDATYTLSSKFEDSLIPIGFSKGEFDYNGTQYTGIIQDDSEVVLGYLVDAEKKGAFFYYDSEKATFAPYEQITISSSTSIILLQNDGTVKLPEEQYKETTVTLNEHTFPAWQDTYEEGYYIMYAINNTGAKGLYKYETSEGTYQKFVAPEEEKQASGIIGKIMNFFEDHLDWAIMGAGLLIVLLLIFLIIMITLAVKLAHRNSELDDLYDEYGIDEDFEDDYQKYDKKKDKKSKKKRKDEDEFDFGSDEDDDFKDRFLGFGSFADEDDEFDDDFFDEPKKKEPVRKARPVKPAVPASQKPAERPRRPVADRPATARPATARPSSARPVRESEPAGAGQHRSSAEPRQRGTGGVIPSQSVHRSSRPAGSRPGGEKVRRPATDRPANSRSNTSRPRREKEDIEFIDL